MLLVFTTKFLVHKSIKFIICTHLLGRELLAAGVRSALIESADAVPADIHRTA